MAIIEPVSLTLGKLANDATLNTAMATKTELTIDEINSNSSLKSALLSKIKFKNANVATADASKFAVSVVKNSDGYSITYTYTGTNETYTRTFKMALS